MQPAVPRLVKDPGRRRIRIPNDPQAVPLETPLQIDSCPQYRHRDRPPIPLVNYENRRFWRSPREVERFGARISSGAAT
jgi:hypothetical protein